MAMFWSWQSSRTNYVFLQPTRSGYKAFSGHLTPAYYIVMFIEVHYNLELQVSHSNNNTMNSLKPKLLWSEMTLNYQGIVERCLVPNGVVGSSIPTVKSSLYLTEK